MANMTAGSHLCIAPLQLSQPPIRRLKVFECFFSLEFLRAPRELSDHPFVRFQVLGSSARRAKPRPDLDTTVEHTLPSRWPKPPSFPAQGLSAVRAIQDTSSFDCPSR
jgi:hypothetical protein